MKVIFMTTPGLVDAQFHHAAPLLQPVIDQAARGEFTVADIERLTREGRAITALFSDHDGHPMLAMAFEFVSYPRQLAVNIMAMGGHGLQDADGIFGQTFRDWCRSAGATVIEASCSPAMARMLRHHGFDVAYQVVRTEL